MSRNFYSEINLHLVWHTKDNLPLLTETIEPRAHHFVRKRLLDTPGVILHAIGGIENHVHVCITIPPTVLFSELIGQIKGGSSHDVNQDVGRHDKVLQWQSGYGVVSFGTRDLEWVVRYVNHQRDHHHRGTMQSRLERTDSEE